MDPAPRAEDHYLTLTHNSTPLDRCAVIAEQIFANDPRLVEINVYNREIGDDGLSELALALHENTTVSLLNVGRNEINNEGASRLATALRTNTTLQTIILRENNIKMTGITLLAVVLKENDTVRSIDLSSNPFGNIGAEQLCELMEENETITELNFRNCNVTDGELEEMLHESLVRNKSDYVANRLRSSDPMDTLLDLQLDNDHFVGDDVMVLADGLRKNKTLHTLNLSHNNIGTTGAQELVKALTRAKAPALTSLDLSDNDLDEEAVDSISELLDDGQPLKLRHLFLAGIGEMRKEEDHQGCFRLADGLRENTILTELDLSRNGIDDEGLTEIVGALLEGGKSAIVSLALADNVIGPAGARELAKLIQSVWQPLDSLRIEHNEIGGVGFAALCEALQTNGQLRLLGVQHNEIDRHGGEALGTCLLYNRSLRRIYLQHNDLGDPGAVAIGKVLMRKNHTLKEVHLSHNNLGLQGISAMNDTMEANEELTVPLVEDQQWTPLHNILEEFLPEGERQHSAPQE